MNTKYKSLLASIIGAVFVIAFSVVLCATECLYSVDKESDIRFATAVK